MTLKEVRARIPNSSFQELKAIANEMDVPMSVVVEASVSWALKGVGTEFFREVQSVEHLRKNRKDQAKDNFNPHGDLTKRQ